MPDISCYESVPPIEFRHDVKLYQYLTVKDVLCRRCIFIKFCSYCHSIKKLIIITIHFDFVFFITYIF